MAGAQQVEAVRKAVIDLDTDKIAKLVREAVAVGASTQQIVEDGMRAGMTEVGRKYEKGEYYLAEFELAAEVMKKGLDALQVLVPWESGGGATIVLATVAGDMHDMGKMLVASLLTSAGYQVIDLGVDVQPARVVEAVRKDNAKVVGLSLVLEAAGPEVGATVEALKESGLGDRVKVILGGATASQELADKYGCDAYVASAFDAVSVIERMVEKKRPDPRRPFLSS